MPRSHRATAVVDGAASIIAIIATAKPLILDAAGGCQYGTMIHGCIMQPGPLRLGSMRQDIEFRTEDGTALRAYLHVPSGAPAAAIVMAHGFSGVREQIDHYAAAFADAGFLVLCYDHRGFGVSGGAIRGEVDPLQQLGDWRDAITYVLGLTEVGPTQKVGVWGSSFAGGLAMVLAAIDRRVGCVVAQIPNVSGIRNGHRIYDVATRARLQQMFDQDRVARLAGEAPTRVPVLTAEPGGICALPPQVSPRYIAAAMAQHATWANEVTLRSVENMLWFEPAAYVRYVTPTPLMMIVGRADDLTFPDLQLTVFAEACEPKRLLIHPGGHFDTYTDHFDVTSSGALSWFSEHLGGAKPTR